jgi:hypothetical protein
LVGDKYDTPPTILGFNEKTPYRPFDSVIHWYLLIYWHTK